MRCISPAVRHAVLSNADLRTRIPDDAGHEFRALFRLYTSTPQRSIYSLKENAMTIKVGDKLPAGKLWELPVEWFAGCPTAADEIQMPDATKGKRIVIFGLPGAYTRT
jgi:hypothetical protein